ncbi:YbaN family protein [Gorillibacterium sp. CAU 1737]|uniref:YbaN family protein n=1 Tax=Gorillibacterium sp. CAU 1737 TaxID=3140362 RepID=UPI00326181BC
MRLIYLVLGFLFFGLGAVGAVLPVLPTTPFLLLAAFFFAKGSKRFHDWFLSTKLYKQYLESFLQSRGMTVKAKRRILIFASSMLTLSFFLVPLWYVKGFIVLVMMFKYYYFFFRIKTIPAEPSASASKSWPA